MRGTGGRGSPAGQQSGVQHSLEQLGAKVLVSETFVSLQGEGKLTGVPSWFCRLSGCNLRCAWCDTPYASWSPEGEMRTLGSLVDEAWASGVRHAVLTGGEPMIFKQLPALCARLREAGLHITIETAGTVYPEPWQAIGGTRPLACDLMSLSPKLANSTPTGDPRDPSGAWAERHESRRFDPEALARLIDDHPDRQLKFVITSADDLAEIETLVEGVRTRLTGALAPSDVMLMPEGVRVPEPREIAWVVEACVERGWRFCPRVQIQLFGDTRGT